MLPGRGVPYLISFGILTMLRYWLGVFEGKGGLGGKKNAVLSLILWKAEAVTCICILCEFLMKEIQKEHF